MADAAAQGQLAYHHIEERTVSVNVQGSSARLVGQIVADVTVYGTAPAHAGN